MTTIVKWATCPSEAIIQNSVKIKPINKKFYSQFTNFYSQVKKLKKIYNPQNSQNNKILLTTHKLLLTIKNTKGQIKTNRFRN